MVANLKIALKNKMQVQKKKLNKKISLLEKLGQTKIMIHVHMSVRMIDRIEER